MSFVRLKAMTTALACAALFVALTSTAQAGLIFTSGNTTSAGKTVSGTAEFDISGSTLQVILTNTSNIVELQEVLDGLSFTLVGGTIGALTNVVPNFDGSGGAFDFEDCTGASCAGTNTFASHQSGAGACTDTTSPYCWLFAAGLLAPQGYHPAGVVNTGISHLDGNTNPQHNDFLVGPVEFDFSFTGNPTGVSNVTFYWGTNPDTTTGTGCAQEPCVLPQPTVPEPGSLALVGLALSGLAWARRRFKS